MYGRCPIRRGVYLDEVSIWGVGQKGQAATHGMLSTYGMCLLRRGVHLGSWSKRVGSHIWDMSTYGMCPLCGCVHVWGVSLGKVSIWGVGQKGQVSTYKMCPLREVST